MGVALVTSEIPLRLLAQPAVERRVHERGGEREVRFLYRAADRRLPVWLDGELRLLRWGNRERSDRKLPPTGWTWLSTVEAGGWVPWEPEPVEIPGNFALENGVWYRIRQGVRGLVVRSAKGEPVVYMVCQPATRYYEVMTRSRRMPVLVDEWI